MKKRLFALSLAIITVMLLPLMTSCNKEDTTPTPTPIVTLPAVTERPIKESTPSDAAIITVGEITTSEKNYNIDISLDNSAGWIWATFEFTINFDPSIMKIVNIKLSDYTKDMMLTPNIDSENGIAKVAAISLSDLTGSGVLCTLECEAVGNGESDITLTEGYMFRIVTFADDNTQASKEIKLETKPGKVTVNGIS